MKKALAKEFFHARQFHIPKIIHQTCPLGAEEKFPDEISRSIEKLRALNPDWEYRLYSSKDQVNFISQNYSSIILDYYYRIDPSYGAARADLFRYLLMYKCGGVYLDIKSSANLPFEKVLKKDDQFVLSHWQNHWGAPYERWGLHQELRSIRRGEYQQWFIVAAPGHPFLKSVIDRVLGNINSYSPVIHLAFAHFSVPKTNL